METNTKALINRENLMALESTHGPMEASTRGTLRWASSSAKANGKSLSKKMESLLPQIGLNSWQQNVLTCFMKANMTWIKRMGLVFLHGHLATSIRDSIKMMREMGTGR